jgi:sec-independent protein translocase protein TatC
MVEEPGTEPLDVQQGEEGGPVKSFLEHLEDLRWVLIKCLAATGVAMLACLLAGNHLVDVLKWPLSRAPVKDTGKTIRLLLGTNQIAFQHVSANDPWSSLMGTNRHMRVELTPVIQEGGMVMGINAQPEDLKRGLDIQIINQTPAGSFIVATKVALYGGLGIASPFIFYYVAGFVFPALRMREKKYVYRGLVFGIGLFLTGVCCCYFVLMPVALAASSQYAQWLGLAVYQWRAEEYISFVCKFMLGMGLGFELPVVVLTLVKIGLVDYRMLARARRYVIVISFVLGAVLTTPEVVTQVLMALPLLLLYEISVWITWYWERRDAKRAAAAATAPD